MLHPSMAPANQLANLKYANISGRPHPTADSLIGRAHRDSTDRELYIVGSKMQVVQTPDASNGSTTIVLATVLMRDANTGETYEFTDLGDANPQNCNAQIGVHAPRMAATRALSRALGQALNVAEAVAEEIAEGGSGQPAVNAAGGGYQAPQQNAAPAQPGQGVRAQFPNAPQWKFTIPYGNHKGKQIDDPTVPDSEVQYHLGRGFNQKNPATGAFDIPDPERAAIFQAELTRRQGGAHNPVAAQPTAAYTPPPAGAVAQQPAQAAYTPPNYNAPAPTAQATVPAAGGERHPTPQHVAELMQLGKAAGRNWPLVKQLCMETFGIDEPIKLGWDEFNMLRMQLGGQPLP